MKLSDFTQGKDNNFNLIRIIAALAVLITHSFALTIGSGDAEPFRQSLGMTMGSIAVDIFFITSGFLVTASLLNKQCAIDFIWARVLRIFPALVVMLIITTLGIGVFFTSMPVASYLSDPSTISYFLNCSTMITGAAYNLPGVFAGNPYKDVVNGSLWSMPYELRMYAAILLIWISLRLTKAPAVKTFQLTIAVIVAIATVSVVAQHFFGSTVKTSTKLIFMFFSGAAFYTFRSKISLSPVFLGLSVMALLISAMANKHLFILIYLLTVAYLLFCLAYLPSGLIRKYNKAGDYSYGLYIYAFPVQQSVVALIPGVSVLAMTIISVVATFILAILSWHILERRALGLKSLYVGHTNRIFRFKPAIEATQTP